VSTLNEKKKEVIEAVLRELHSGVSLEVLKERFKEFLKDISPMEIPLIEQELVGRGFQFKKSLNYVIYMWLYLEISLFQGSLKMFQGVIH